MLEECGGCGTRFAPDLERCPHCGREAGEMPKILKGAGPSFPEEHVHPGSGEEMHGIEHPADGTMSPTVGNDAAPGAPEPEQVTQMPEGEFAEPVPEPQAPDAAPEPAPALPRVPPRLTPPEPPGD